jgi:hypothetical protein
MRADRSRRRSWLEVELNAVAVPKRLLARLRRIALLPEEEVESRLDAIPVPGSLTVRLRSICSGKPWRSVVRQWTAVAAFLGVLWLGYAGAVLGLVSSVSARPATLPGRWTPIRQMLPPIIVNLPVAPAETS